jgi:hypothetical protein
VFFNGADELRWSNALEIQSGQSILGDMVLVFVVDMTSISAIYIDPQFGNLREERKAILVTLFCAWAIVVRKNFKTPTSPSAFGQLAIVLSDTEVHSIWVNDSKTRIPRRRTWVTTRRHIRVYNSAA